MKKVINLSLLVLAAIVLLAASVDAEKPARMDDTLPNGFISGDHYNLNIIGKKEGFNCQKEQVDADGNPVYGKVVFIPEEGNAQIYMQSGKGSKFEAFTTLQVLDPCAGDGDGATLRLPKNDLGYRVFARALGKPVGLDRISLTPWLNIVEDENGNDLLYLGLVTNNGFQPSSQPFTRIKGKSKAIEISDLFKWYGSICYFSIPDGTYDTQYVCCDTTDSVTGECTAYIYVGEGDTCGDGSAIPVYCSDYTTDPAPWVFNIAEFVEYLWTTDNKGTKLLQVRFYPN
ncbi:MAG: hypothetical protein PVI53_18255 [Desulfobacteraceae bacterium]